MGKPGCGAPGCKAHHYAKGLCRKHYVQWHKYGRLIPEREHGARVCEAPRCDRPSIGRPHRLAPQLGRLCRKHRAQVEGWGRLTPERERGAGGYVPEPVERPQAGPFADPLGRPFGGGKAVARRQIKQRKAGQRAGQRAAGNSKWAPLC